MGPLCSESIDTEVWVDSSGEGREWVSSEQIKHSLGAQEVPSASTVELELPPLSARSGVQVGGHVCHSQVCSFKVHNGFSWCLVSGDVHRCAFGSCLRYKSHGERGGCSGGGNEFPNTPESAGEDNKMGAISGETGRVGTVAWRNLLQPMRVPMYGSGASSPQTVVCGTMAGGRRASALLAGDHYLSEASPVAEPSLVATAVAFDAMAPPSPSCGLFSPSRSVKLPTAYSVLQGTPRVGAGTKTVGENYRGQSCTESVGVCGGTQGGAQTQDSVSTPRRRSRARSVGAGQVVGSSSSSERGVWLCSLTGRVFHRRLAGSKLVTETTSFGEGEEREFPFWSHERRDIQRVALVHNYALVLRSKELFSVDALESTPGGGADSFDPWTSLCKALDHRSNGMWEEVVDSCESMNNVVGVHNPSACGVGGVSSHKFRVKVDLSQRCSTRRQQNSLAPSALQPRVRSVCLSRPRGVVVVVGVDCAPGLLKKRKHTPGFPPDLDSQSGCVTRRGVNTTNNTQLSIASFSLSEQTAQSKHVDLMSRKMGVSANFGSGSFYEDSAASTSLKRRATERARWNRVNAWALVNASHWETLRACALMTPFSRNYTGSTVAGGGVEWGVAETSPQGVNTDIDSWACRDLLLVKEFESVLALLVFSEIRQSYTPSKVSLREVSLGHAECVGRSEKETSQPQGTHKSLSTFLKNKGTVRIKDCTAKRQKTKKGGCGEEYTVKNVQCLRSDSNIQARSPGCISLSGSSVSEAVISLDIPNSRGCYGMSVGGGAKLSGNFSAVPIFSGGSVRWPWVHSKRRGKLSLSDKESRARPVIVRESLHFGGKGPNESAMSTEVDCNERPFCVENIPELSCSTTHTQNKEAPPLLQSSSREYFLTGGVPTVDPSTCQTGRENENSKAGGGALRSPFAAEKQDCFPVRSRTRKRKRHAMPPTHEMSIGCGDTPFRDLKLNFRKRVKENIWRGIVKATIALWHCFCRSSVNRMNEQKYTFRKHVVISLYHAQFGVTIEPNNKHSAYLEQKFGRRAAHAAAVRASTHKKTSGVSLADVEFKFAKLRRSSLRVLPVVKYLHNLLPYLADLGVFGLSSSEIAAAHTLFVHMCGRETSYLGVLCAGPLQVALVTGHNCNDF
jgi:hypothetical protein